MSASHPLHVVILAAGRGTRMRTQRPKVLHTIAGQPMLKHIAGTATRLGAEAVHVIVGHGAEQIQQSHADMPINWVIQEVNHEQTSGNQKQRMNILTTTLKYSDHYVGDKTCSNSN